MEPLRLNEVGAFGQLSARPNPEGLVVVSVPPFESMLPFLEQRLGRALRSDEIETHRAAAPSIVLLAQDAAKISAARSKPA